MKHQLTFSLVHPTFFAVAVGLFFGTVKSSHFGGLRSLLLIVLLSLGVACFIADFFSHKIDAIMVNSVCTELSTESILRNDWRKLLDLPRETDDQKTQYEAAVKLHTIAIATYENKPWRKETSIQILWKHGSFVAWLVLAINLVFGLFVISYFWFLITVLGPWNKSNRDNRVYGPLIAIWALLVCWIPCRMYADWHLGAFLYRPTVAPPTNFALYFACIFALLSGAYIVFFLIRDLFKIDHWSILFGMLGLMGAIVGFLFTPTFFVQLADTLRAMPLLLFFALGIGCFLGIGGIALDIVSGNAGPNLRNKSPINEKISKTS